MHLLSCGDEPSTRGWAPAIPAVLQLGPLPPLQVPLPADDARAVASHDLCSLSCSPEISSYRKAVALASRVI